MDRARLNAILEAYGGDPAHWPGAEREAALRLIAADTELARAQIAAISLDRVLARAPAGEVSNDLLTRILETAPRPAMKPLAPRAGKARLFEGIGASIGLPSFGGAIAGRPIAIVMLAICIGLGAGALVPTMVDAAPSEVDMLSLMWGDPAFNQDGGDS